MNRAIRAILPIHPPFPPHHSRNQPAIHMVTWSPTTPIHQTTHRPTNPPSHRVAESSSHPSIHPATRPRKHPHPTTHYPTTLRASGAALAATASSPSIDNIELHGFAFLMAIPQTAKRCQLCTPSSIGFQPSWQWLRASASRSVAFVFHLTNIATI